MKWKEKKIQKDSIITEIPEKERIELRPFEGNPKTDERRPGIRGTAIILSFKEAEELLQELMKWKIDIVTITITAIFNSGKINKKEVKESIENKIAKLEGANLDNYEIKDKDFIEVIISVPKSVFESQGPNNIEEIEEFIEFFGPIFLTGKRINVKIKSVKAELSS